MGRRYKVIRIDPYKDYRGELRKVFTGNMLESNKSIEEIYVLYTKKGHVRGNHYHKKIMEIFAVIKGTATISVMDLETGERDTMKVSAEDNTVIMIPENVAHGFRNDEEYELIILAAATGRYKDVDNDTYPNKLL